MCGLKNKLIAKTVMWLATEILFNFVGIDDLADYSEFVFEKKSDKNAVFGTRLTQKSARSRAAKIYAVNCPNCNVSQLALD